MSRLSAQLAGLGVFVGDQIDLFLRLPGRMTALLAAFGLIGVWYLVPADQCLLRLDLVPWTALCASVILAIQAGPLGPTAHPQLRPLRTPLGQVAKRVGVLLVPQLLLSFFTLGLTRTDRPMGCLSPDVDRVGELLPSDLGRTLPLVLRATVLLFAIAGLAALSKDEGRTAWNPPLKHRWLWRLSRAAMGVGAAAAALGAGLSSTVVDETDIRGAATLVAGSFLLAGLLWSREQDYAQDEALGDREVARVGRASRLSFRSGDLLVAAVLPAIGLFLLDLLLHLSDLDTSQSQGAGIALFLYLVAVVIWPGETVTGVSALLHEVEPVGEALASQTGAGADTGPPAGTLLFHPDRVRRTGMSIPWLVPSTRITGASALRGKEPLWADLSLSPLAHVLGAAAAPLSRRLPQVRRLSIALLPGGDIAPLLPGDNQDRRLMVYTAWPPLAGEASEPDVDLNVQNVDAASERVALFNGSVILVRSGLVSVLYELELGAPLTAVDPLPLDDLPQFQDHEVP